MIILSFVAMIIGCTQMGDLYVIFDDASQKIYLGKGIEKGVEQVTTHLGMYKDFHGAELKEWLDDGSIYLEIRFMFTSGPQGNGSRSGANRQWKAQIVHEINEWWKQQGDGHILNSEQLQSIERLRSQNPHRFQGDTLTLWAQLEAHSPRQRDELVISKLTNIVKHSEVLLQSPNKEGAIYYVQIVDLMKNSVCKKDNYNVSILLTSNKRAIEEMIPNALATVKARDHHIVPIASAPPMDHIQDNSEEILLAAAASSGDDFIGRATSEGNVGAHAVDTEDQRQVRLWMTNTVKLPDYTDLLMENGFDSLEMFQHLSLQDLTDMGIVKIGHKKKIFAEAEKLQMNVVPEQEILPAYAGFDSFDAQPGSVIAPPGM